MNKKQLRQHIHDRLPYIKRDMGLPWLSVALNVKSSQSYYMSIRAYSIYPWVTLNVDTSCCNLSEKAIDGLLAHEIAHCYSRDERIADWLAARAGYRDGLIEFHKHHNKKHKAFNEREGLSLEELKGMGSTSIKPPRAYLAAPLLLICSLLLLISAFIYYLAVDGNVIFFILLGISVLCTKAAGNAMKLMPDTVPA